MAIKSSQRFVGSFLVIACSCSLLCSHPAQAGYIVDDLYTLTPPKGVTLVPGDLASGVDGYRGTAASNAGSNKLHAVFFDSRGNFVDLYPANLPPFDSSMILQASESQQVGFGSFNSSVTNPNGKQEALLWHGTADSAVLLHMLCFGPAPNDQSSTSNQPT